MSDKQTIRVIVQNLRRLRDGKSFYELAKECDTYPSNIKRIFDGETMPGAGILARLAKALGVTANDLLAETRPAVAKKMAETV